MASCGPLRLAAHSVYNLKKMQKSLQKSLACWLQFADSSALLYSITVSYESVTDSVYRKDQFRALTTPLSLLLVSHAKALLAF